MSEKNAKTRKAEKTALEVKLLLRETEVVDYLKDFTLGDAGSFLQPSGGNRTAMERVTAGNSAVPRFINEFWTAKQRQASSIHEISYRACFKAQLPRFFIELLTAPGDTVYDPFGGRGTTAIEAGLLGRRVISNDINPLSKIMACPRLAIPETAAIRERLEGIPLSGSLKAGIDLSMFYHPATKAEIESLRRYLDDRKNSGREDHIDRWIRMVATNRLTGHSSGFFSVYTLPPNQAVSAESQIKINHKRNQAPDYRDTSKIIIKKTAALMKNLTPDALANLREAAGTAVFLEEDARHTDAIEENSIKLTVTSPPFLDIVHYSADNWLRCWFNNIDTAMVEKKITMARTVEEWSAVMGAVFNELYRITRPDGWVAFEVGEVRRGKICLDEYVIPLGLASGFSCAGVIVNRQRFTKTSNIWGVFNNSSGTNTNRIALFHKTNPAGII